MMPSICLGTAQFGSSYGITNKQGKVSTKEVKEILSYASMCGIKFLDTAQAYGEAERLIGEYWPKSVPNKLISKLPRGSSPESWERSFSLTLDKLQSKKLDSFLIHHPSDLLSNNGKELLYWLESLVDRNLVNRIGVSIYDKSELKNLPLNKLHIVQLPLSVYDQRLLIDGTVSKLYDMGIAIHARSIFLQGLLLQESIVWPAFISNEFKNHHERWMNHIRVSGLTPLQGALQFVYQCKELETILIGITSKKELQEICNTWKNIQCNLLDICDWSWTNSSEIDPRNWP